MQIPNTVQMTVFCLLMRINTGNCSVVEHALSNGMELRKEIFYIRFTQTRLWILH